ncbi:MAG: ribonuclease III [Candidatus Woykebacteria bacterium RIFCSPHIGHO2_12_FULL_45_10]|uniref:Ribonuclease 3 n=1 Tax=Candidatus Woykebacteria bacterium RIFCSPHIGHO2_12_FULL_45_10 TaxID=1802603 RepID=A0A1G1WPB6_9BACT|nr:MAG: ribonuclease III [Candidatus Woykebacteria bacterium RIFCSPHIGHO2_12_FULL_45_10]
MLEKLEKKLKLKFQNRKLIETAFTHRSYLNEHPLEAAEHNERLEFLGDSVLGFLVSEHLFKAFPESSEGDLTNYRSALVNANSLARVAAKLDLGQYLLLSKGEEATGGRQREYLLANTFEAFLGALYLDLGLETAKKFVEESLLPNIEPIIAQKLYRDFKSQLQEIAQEKLSITPIYKVLSEEGPDHSKNFRMGVFFEERLVAEGFGASKQKAEQAAASSALANIDKIR